MKETPHHSKSVSGLPIVQQKILCAMAYLGRNYHLHLPLDQILSWVEVEEPLYKDHIRILCSKGWLVEEKNHLDGTSVLLVNPRKLPEVLDFLLCTHTEWKAEIESLTPHFSPFKAFEDLLMAFFNADIIDSCNILPRVCQSLTEKQGTAREMLSLFRYYSHGEFSPIERGTTAYTFILYGLRYQHQGDNKKAASMWAHALKLNGDRLFRNPLTLYLLMASHAKGGEEGIKSLQSFLQDKHKHPLDAVPAIILAEYYASKSRYPSSWRLSEYLRHCNQPYHRLKLMMGLLLARMFGFDIPLDVDTELMPNHRILRHEFQCVIPLDAGEIISLKKKFGKVAGFSSIPSASWQQNLEELIENCKTGSTLNLGLNGKKGRIIYLINGSSVSVRHQFCNAKGEWDTCKRIQLYEYTASMPEMNEMDIAIYNNCKGNMLQLGLENTLPFLVGSDRVFTGILPPYKPVSIRNVIPALVVEKAEDGLMISSNFPPEEFLRCGKTEFIIRRDEKSYDVIHIQHAQEPYFRKLLSHPKLPFEAKPKLKILASMPSLPICIMSGDLPAMNTFSFINGREDITIRITPRRNGDFDISFVCYPLKGGKVAFTPGIGNSLYSDTDGSKFYCINRNHDNEILALESMKSKLSAIFKRTVRLSEDTISRVQLFDFLTFWHEKGGNAFTLEWPAGGRIAIHDNSTMTNSLYLSHISTTWFQLQGRVYIDEEYYLDICELLAVLKRKPINSYYPVDERTYIRLSHCLEKQLKAVGHIATRNDSTVMIPSVRAAELVSLGNKNLSIDGDEQFCLLQQRIKDAHAAKFDIPSGLNATLRSYQKAGFEWMARLDHWGAGGCLADDMGLGKTVQTVTMLLYKAELGVSMVVSPAAVLYNWADEISRFAPSLNPIVLRDQPDRTTTLSLLKACDVLLVSYSMLVNMSEDLLPVEWNMVCLDEAHVIKSAKTEMAKVVLRLKARTRLALTGTPLQNKAIDIWSVFHFLNPGLLGEHSSFYSYYASNPLQQERLRKVLSPFILRRTKKEVLHELPPKTDIIIRTEMNPQEAAVYEAVRKKAELAISISDGNIRSIFSHIISARMAACTASLLHPDIDVPSSKLEKLMLLIGDLTAQEKKVLVFSQFIPFLKMAGERLSADGHSCLLYTGMQDSKKRQEIIQRFKSGEVEVLLISLQAGGVGLNLTEACAVIHLDVWWNPAIEQQATDRVYRIGQKENVTVYHLVARNTIEEKIVRLHHRKLNLASSILDGTDACLNMSPDDITNILKK